MEKLLRTICVDPAGKYFGLSSPTWELAQGLQRSIATRRRSPFPSHDYPEYETPSKQYENGPITHFGVIAGLPRPYYDLSLIHI